MITEFSYYYWEYYAADADFGADSGAHSSGWPGVLWFVDFPCGGVTRAWTELSIFYRLFNVLKGHWMCGCAVPRLPLLVAPGLWPIWRDKLEIQLPFKDVLKTVEWYWNRLNDAKNSWSLMKRVFIMFNH